MGPRGLGPKTIKLLKLLKSLKFMKTSVFFEHGKDAHQHFTKGALNESSISLILSFWEQIVFLKIGEKVPKYQNWINFEHIPDCSKRL